MPPESGETRTLYVPRTGTKVLLLVGLALVIAAIYVAVVPLNVTSNSGPNFGCGTALSPNNDSLGKIYCSAVDSSARYRAIALGVGGLALAGAGAALFGFDTSTRTRKTDPGFDDGYDDAADDSSRGRHGERGTGNSDRALGEEARASRREGRAHTARQPATARTGGASPARVGGASPAPRRAAFDRRSAVDTLPAHASHDSPSVSGSGSEQAAAMSEDDPQGGSGENSAGKKLQDSLRRPFGERFADNDRRRVGDDNDDDQLDGPRTRR